MNKTKINYYIVINSRTRGKLQLTIGCASLISLSLYIHTFYITCHQPLVFASACHSDCTSYCFMPNCLRWGIRYSPVTE